MATLNLGKVAFTYDDFTPDQLALMKGEKGDPGDKGERGETGLRGSRWNTGTAITGTSTADTVYATGIDDSLANDYYFNSSTGCVYVCTLGGDANTARWKFVSDIGSTSFEVKPGYKWKTVDSKISNVKSIAYGKNTLVAVGTNPNRETNGNIAYSIDRGINWNKATVPVTTALNSVAYSEYRGIFIAVGEKGTSLKSNDGITWELIEEDTTSARPNSLRCVKCHDKFVIAVGGKGYDAGGYTAYNPLIITLDDNSSSWNVPANQIGGSTQGITSLLHTVCFGSSGCVVGGYNFIAILRNYAYGNDMRDGWTVAYEDTSLGNVTSIIHDGGGFVGVGSNGYSFTSDKSAYDYSGWTVEKTNRIIGSPLDIGLIGRYDYNGTYIAVGEGSNRGYDNNIFYSSKDVSDMYEAQKEPSDWKNTWDELSVEGNNFKYAETINSISCILNVGTFLGGNDGTIISLEDEISTINVTDAVKEMYEKLILQK